MNRDEWVNEIAQSVFEIPTLEPRGRDHLDFHNLHVNALKAALQLAFDAGHKEGKLEMASMF